MRPDFEQTLKNPVAATVTLYYELMRKNKNKIKRKPADAGLLNEKKEHTYDDREITDYEKSCDWRNTSGFFFEKTNISLLHSIPGCN